jgi:transposase
MSGLQPVGMDEMKQRNLVCFMRLKGLSKKAIHHELVAMLLENAVSYSGATRFYSAGRLFWA